MRITKVSVKKLFGIFDHEIPLNQESRITIIHGPNGVGKTVLLTMLNGLFNASYRAFRDVPFEEFRVYLDHQVYLILTKENDELVLSFANVTGSYTMNLLEHSGGDPEWLDHIKRNIDVELIKTQRLQTEVAIEPDSSPVDTLAQTRIRGLAVEEYSAKTAKLVHDVLGARRLTDAQFDEIKAINSELASLLGNERLVEGLDHEKMLERIAYVESTLDIIQRRETDADEKRSRLMMLVELLNGHYSFKRVFSDAQSGLVIVDHDGQLIPVASLSSGEQHQLVLFSKLLFDLPAKLTRFD